MRIAAFCRSVKAWRGFEAPFRGDRDRVQTRVGQALDEDPRCRGWRSERRVDASRRTRGSMCPEEGDETRGTTAGDRHPYFDAMDSGSIRHGHETLLHQKSASRCRLPNLAGDIVLDAKSHRVTFRMRVAALTRAHDARSSVSRHRTTKRHDPGVVRRRPGRTYPSPAACPCTPAPPAADRPGNGTPSSSCCRSAARRAWRSGRCAPR